MVRRRRRSRRRRARPPASTTRPPARRPPSRPRAPSTSTSTGSAATSARTATARRCGSACACARPGNASRSRTPWSTSGTATRRAATRSPARPTCAARRSRTRRDRRVHDGVPRLVSRPHRAHPREGASRQGDRAHHAVLLRRHRQRARVRDAPYAGESNRDGFNESDGLYDRDLELTLSEEGDSHLGLITLDVARQVPHRAASSWPRTSRRTPRANVPCRTGQFHSNSRSGEAVPVWARAVLDMKTEASSSWRRVSLSEAGPSCSRSADRTSQRTGL